MEPKVIFEDSEVLVLDKPSGMIVNRSDTTKGERTVQEWVENKFKVQSEKLKVDEDSDFHNRAGIVHRLDKETSGILLVAKTPQSFENLQKQFKERKVKKTYLALVHGEVKIPEGEINVPVGRLPWNRKRFGVLTGGRDAVTKYKVLSICHYNRHSGNSERSVEASRISNSIRDAGSSTRLAEALAKRASMTGSQELLSLLELYPETGRTHQIRVHLQYFHHPIFADPLYGGRKTARNDRKLLSRIFLHAAKISFHHPSRGEVISFESKLPEELSQFLESLDS